LAEALSDSNASLRSIEASGIKKSLNINNSSLIIFSYEIIIIPKRTNLDDDYTLSANRQASDS
jgi:hypothetical protein